MKTNTSHIVVLIVALASLLSLASTGHAQDHSQHEASVSSDINTQIAELRALVLRLESALLEEHSASASSMGKDNSSGRAMGKHGMGGKKDMDMGDAKGMSMGRMGGMSMGDDGDMSSMPMMDRMMMKGMSRMGAGTKGGSTQSALPGFPGASHIYHVGATGFFLDHTDHVVLTVEQQTELSAIKERTLLSQATRERQIEQAEQALWVLTASDSPEIGAIETKVREIERLNGDQRIDFIRAVGNAAAVLTDEQRRSLAGYGAAAATQPESHAEHDQ